MILVDGNNLTSRMFHVAKEQTLKEFEKRMKTNPLERPNQDELFELQAVFLHLTLSELLMYKQKYSSSFGEVLVCYDSGNGWRRQVYAGYKSARRKEQEKKTVFEKFTYTLIPLLTKSLNTILSLTQFHVISDIKMGDVGVEADDIIAVAVKTLQGRHLICSTDQDFIQLLNEYIRQYHPFHKKLLDIPSKKAVQLWKDVNLIGGQSKDSIPGIMEQCHLDDAFIAWMKNVHDIQVDHSMLEKIEKDHKYLMMDYETKMAEEDEIAIASGTRKKRRYLTAYKKPRMGETGVLKFMLDFEKNLDINPRYRVNLERNKTLLLFEYIPKEIETEIVRHFHFETKFFNVIELQNKLLQFRLYTLHDNIGQF